MLRNMHTQCFIHLFVCFSFVFAMFPICQTPIKQNTFNSCLRRLSLFGYGSAQIHAKLQRLASSHKNGSFQNFSCSICSGLHHSLALVHSSIRSTATLNCHSSNQPLLLTDTISHFIVI